MRACVRSQCVRMCMNWFYGVSVSVFGCRCIYAYFHKCISLCICNDSINIFYMVNTIPLSVIYNKIIADLKNRH